MSEDTETKLSTVATDRFDGVVIWLRKQWRASLAKSIWDGLTPFGRITLWVPVWLGCWVALPIVLLLAGIMAAFARLKKHFPKLPPIFFAR